MLAQIVGNVDPFSAAVLCVAFITTCIVVTTLIGKRKTKGELTMQFEIDKEKLANEDRANARNNQRQHEVELATLAFRKEVEFKKIDSGMIEVVKN